MADKTWKATERKVAEILGGVRRGADFIDKDGTGKTDVVLDGYAIEVKHASYPAFGLLITAVEQAQLAACSMDGYPIPIGVVHKSGTHHKMALVVMDYVDFCDHFFNPSSGIDAQIERLLDTATKSLYREFSDLGWWVALLMSRRVTYLRLTELLVSLRESTDNKSIPVVVTKKLGKKPSKPIAVMLLRDFKDWFVNIPYTKII